MKFTYSWRKMAKLFANSGDPDQTPQNAVSDLGLHCLPITLFTGPPDYNGLMQVNLHLFSYHWDQKN